MYEERKYRLNTNQERFDYFTIVHLETDLLIGISKGQDVEKIRSYAQKVSQDLRTELDVFIHDHPSFQSSLSPLNYKKGLSNPIQELVLAGQYANVGPMAGIAGLFSMYVGQALASKFKLKEIIIENGGDIYASILNELKVAIYAGKSVLSNKLALKIPPGEWGICSSSGTVGHSLSFGKADAVAIVSHDPPKADTLATALANRIQSKEDIQNVLDFSKQYDVISAIVIICEDQLGILGQMELMPI